MVSQHQVWGTQIVPWRGRGPAQTAPALRDLSIAIFLDFPERFLLFLTTLCDS